MVVDIDIHFYLPHREPMLMVDRIVSMDEESVETTFTITENNIFIEGGVLCEAGLIENAAQTCSSVIASSFFTDNKVKEGNKDVVGFISSVKTVKIYVQPEIGNTITTKAELLSRFDTGAYITCMMRCNSYCNGELLLEGEINLFIQER